MAVNTRHYRSPGLGPTCIRGGSRLMPGPSVAYTHSVVSHCKDSSGYESWSNRHDDVYCWTHLHQLKLNSSAFLSRRFGKAWSRPIFVSDSTDLDRERLSFAEWRSTTVRSQLQFITIQHEWDGRESRTIFGEVWYLGGFCVGLGRIFLQFSTFISVKNSGLNP